MVRGVSALPLVSRTAVRLIAVGSLVWIQLEESKRVCIVVQKNACFFKKHSTHGSSEGIVQLMKHS